MWARAWSVEATQFLKVELGVQLDVKERGMPTQAEPVLKGLVFSTQKSGIYYRGSHRGILRGNKFPSVVFRDMFRITEPAQRTS